MERAAELEAEVERLRAELEEATAAKVRVADDQAEGVSARSGRLSSASSRGGTPCTRPSADCET